MKRHIMQAAVITGVLALATMFAPVTKAEEGAAKEKPAKAKSHQFTGHIESINAEAGTITAKHSTQKDNTKTFKLGDGCKFKMPGKDSATLADFKAGDKVQIKYTGEEGEQAVASSIQIPVEKAEKEGKDKDKEKEKSQ
jgi:Cu/Ag efflux protein CusF